MILRTQRDVSCRGVSAAALLAAVLVAGCSRGPVGSATAPVSPAVVSLPTPGGEPVVVPTVPANSFSPSSPAAAPVAGFSLPIGGDLGPPVLPAASSAAAPASPAVSGLNESIPVPAAPPTPAVQQARPASRPAPASGAPQNNLVHLSAGLALPQSLPDGTVMGMSMDYAVNSRLNVSSKYYWVIKSGAGETVSEVKLDVQGNLSAFFTQLKPEHRPFSAHIEEITSASKRRVIVSNELPLQTSY